MNESKLNITEKEATR